MQESGENKIILDATQNEKGKESVSSLWNNWNKAKNFINFA